MDLQFVFSKNVLRDYKWKDEWKSKNIEKMITQIDILFCSRFAHEMKCGVNCTYNSNFVEFT